MIESCLVDTNGASSVAFALLAWSAKFYHEGRGYGCVNGRVASGVWSCREDRHPVNSLFSSGNGNTHQAKYTNRNGSSGGDTLLKKEKHRHRYDHQKYTNDETRFVQWGSVHTRPPWGSRSISKVHVRLKRSFPHNLQGHGKQTTTNQQVAFVTVLHEACQF